jgi:hypothetical protein
MVSMYDYETEKQKLYNDAGQRLFIMVRDRVKALVRESGAVRMQEAMTLPRGIGCSDTWMLMACVERMCELGELCEVPTGNAPAQHRVFVSND